MADNKTYLTQFITDFKTRNSQRLFEMRTESPELLTAVEDILKYLGKRYGVEEEVVVVPEIIAPPVQTKPTGSDNLIPLKNWEATFILNGRNIVSKGNTWTELKKSFRDYMNDDVMGVLMRLTWEDDRRIDPTLQNRDVFDTLNNKLKGDVSEILKNVIEKSYSHFSEKYSFTDQFGTKTVIPLQDWTFKIYDEDGNVLGQFTGNDWKSMNKTVYEEPEKIDYNSIELRVVWKDMTMVNSGKISDKTYISRFSYNSIVGTLADVVREIFLRKNNLDASNYSWNDDTISIALTQPSVSSQPSTSSTPTSKIILEEWNCQFYDSNGGIAKREIGFTWNDLNKTLYSTLSVLRLNKVRLVLKWEDKNKEILWFEDKFLKELEKAAIDDKDGVKYVKQVSGQDLKQYSFEDAPTTSVVSQPSSSAPITNPAIRLRDFDFTIYDKDGNELALFDGYDWKSMNKIVSEEPSKYNLDSFELNVYWGDGTTLNTGIVSDLKMMREFVSSATQGKISDVVKSIFISNFNTSTTNYSWEDAPTTSIQPSPPVLVASNSAIIIPPAPLKKVATGSIEIQFWEFEITDQTRGLLMADGVDWKSLNESFFQNFHPSEFESLEIRITWEDDTVILTTVNYKEDEFDELLTYRNNINNWVLKNFEELTNKKSDDYQFEDVPSVINTSSQTVQVSQSSPTNQLEQKFRLVQADFQFYTSKNSYSKRAVTWTQLNKEFSKLMDKYKIVQFTIMVAWNNDNPFVVTGLTESNAPYVFELLLKNRNSLNKWVEEVSEKSPNQYEFEDNAKINQTSTTNNNETKPYKLKKWTIKNSVLGIEITDDSWYELNVQFFLKINNGNFAAFSIELEWENGFMVQIDMNKFSPIVPQIIKAIGKPDINETIKRFFDLIAPAENKKDYQFFDGNTGLKLPSQKTLEKWEKENPEKLAKFQEKLDAATISTPKKKGRPKKEEKTPIIQKPFVKKKIEEVKSADDIVDLDIDDIEI